MKKLILIIAAFNLIFLVTMMNSFAGQFKNVELSRDSISCCDSIPEITIVGDSAICYGDTTQLCVSDTDSCYNYLWIYYGDTISYNPCIYVSDSGYYEVIVSNNCYYSIDYFYVTVNNPVVNINNLHYHQCISCGFYAEAVAYGGCGSYTYLWNSGDTTSTVDSLCYGQVCVTVTDGCGCTSVDCEIPSLSRSLNATISCVNSGNCVLTANGSGGTPPYTYYWSTGATTQSIIASYGITYYVTVTDQAGCTKVASRPCNCLPSKSAHIDEITFKIYPNPASTSITIDSELPEIGYCVVELTDVAGKIIMQSEYNVSNSSIELNVADLPRGMYFVEIKNKEVIFKEKLILK